MLKSATSTAGSGDKIAPTSLSAIFVSLSGMVRNAGAGGLLGGGLNELVENFQQSGHSDTVSSWVRTGPNTEILPPDLKRAIGPEVLAALERQTGLSEDELLSQLSRDLPSPVDRYTPDGQLPPNIDQQH